MPERRVGSFWMSMLLVIVWVIGGPGVPAAGQAPEDVAAVITSPAENELLFGLVTITGTAASPAFAAYTLEYKDLRDPAAPWFLVQERVTQQVQDGILGAWNTNMVPDGFYRLRLRVVLETGESAEFVVSNVQVANLQPTAIPTVAPGSSGAGVVDPSPGPSPTSPIEQPPSSNPEEAPISGLALNPPAESDTEPLARDVPTSTTTKINISRVRSAFCSGVYLAFVAFAFLLVYLLVRRRAYPRTYHLDWQTDDDPENTRYP